MSRWDEPINVPPYDLPCGGTARFDRESSTYSHRCDSCFAVVDSVGMPRQCKELLDKERKAHANLV